LRANPQMAMRVDGWAYGMSQKGRTFDLHGHAYQWTGVKIQKIRVTRKVLEFPVSLIFGAVMHSLRRHSTPRP
jgi:hypothetical protein